jgi:hypothetical protein
LEPSALRKPSHSKAASEYRWNYFTRFIIQGFVELQAALVQLFSSTLDSLSTVLSSVALVVCLSAPAVFSCFIIKYASRLSDDSELAKRWGSLFEEFKYDRGWKSSSFYVVFLSGVCCMSLCSSLCPRSL